MRLVFILCALGATGCSLIVEQKKSQCQSDADCAAFAPHPFCVSGVCVESGLGPQGCTVSSSPSADVDYFNACTTAGCIPFDNCARLQRCDAAAELPALLARP